MLFRYLLLGTGIGLLLAALLLQFQEVPPEILEQQRRDLGVRVILVGAEEKKGEDGDWMATPPLMLPTPVKKDNLYHSEKKEREETEWTDGERMARVTGEVGIEEVVRIGEVGIEEREKGEGEMIPEEKEPVQVTLYIPYNTPALQIVQMLLQAQLITDEEEFLADLVSREALHSLQAGEHHIPVGSSHREIIQQLLGRR